MPDFPPAKLSKLESFLGHCYDCSTRGAARATAFATSLARTNDKPHPCKNLVTPGRTIVGGGQAAITAKNSVASSRGSLPEIAVSMAANVPTMDAIEFRTRGKEMVDYIADYLESIAQRRVTPAVEPGYLRQRLPENAPQHGEEWDEIMDDVEQHIMPGVSSFDKFGLVSSKDLLPKSVFCHN